MLLLLPLLLLLLLFLHPIYHTITRSCGCCSRHHSLDSSLNPPSRACTPHSFGAAAAALARPRGWRRSFLLWVQRVQQGVLHFTAQRLQLSVYCGEEGGTNCCCWKNGSLQALAGSRICPICQPASARWTCRTVDSVVLSRRVSTLVNTAG